MILAEIRSPSSIRVMTSRIIIAGLCAAGLGLSAHADLTTDLVVYYDFEDLTNDPLASGPDATEAGTGSYTGIAGGVVGNAAEFTGTTGDFIDTAIGFGGGGGDELGNNFTVAAWYNVDVDASSATSRFFVFEGDGDYDLSYGVRDLSGGAFYNDTQTYTNGPTAGDAFANHQDVHVQGTWQHVAISYSSDGTDTTVTTYIDGVAASRLTEATAELASAGIHIGNARSSALNRAFDGKIDEFAAWSRALAPTEVVELRERALAGFGVTEDLGAQNKFVVALASSDDPRGQVTGVGIYDLGATPTIVATPEPGYVFSQWTGGFAGRPVSFTHTVAADVAAVADFAEDGSDPDNDGLTTYEELRVYFTLPNNPDSDGDGIPDGVEVNTTGTDPNFADDLAVDYILANLCTGGAGPDGIVLTRDGGSDSVSMKVAAEDTLALDGWDPLVPADATTSGAGGNGLQILLPGTTDAARFFRFAVAAPEAAP